MVPFDSGDQRTTRAPSRLNRQTLSRMLSTQQPRTYVALGVFMGMTLLSVCVMGSAVAESLSPVGAANTRARAATQAPTAQGTDTARKASPTATIAPTPTVRPTATTAPTPTAPPPATPPPARTGVNGNPWGFDFNPTGGTRITSPPAGFCGYFDCIPAFNSGRGYVIQCQDKKYSRSGGLSGACYLHGGPGPTLYAHGSY